jgi:hypothetical protein
LIDFDDVRYSYTVLNLAQFFYIGYFRKSVFLDGLPLEDLASRISKAGLSEIEMKNFMFFVLLSGFHWEVETTPFETTVIEERVGLLENRLNSCIEKASLIDGWIGNGP